MLFLNWDFRCNRTKYLKAVYHPKNLSRARGLNGMAFPQISLFNHCECTVCLNTIFPPVSRLKRTNCCYLHRKKIESVWIVVDFSFFCTAQSMWFHHGIHPQRFFFIESFWKRAFLYCIVVVVAIWSYQTFITIVHTISIYNYSVLLQFGCHV